VARVPERRLKRTRYPSIYEVVGGKRPRYMVSYRIPGVGQRTKTKPTLAEARDFQAQVRDPSKARQLRQLERGRITLGEYFPTWLERKRNLTPATKSRYEGVGRLYICNPEGRIARVLVANLMRDDIEDWITWLADIGVHPPTIDKAYRTLRAALETAFEEGKSLSNPARRIELPDILDREPFFLTARQVDAVANEVPERDRALVYFLAYTGLRMGEASALRLRHLDLRTGKVSIRVSSPEVGGRKIQDQKTKTKRVRSITLSDPLIHELSVHLERFGVRVAGRGELDPQGFIFTGERGAQVRQGNWRERVFQPACWRAGITRSGRDGSLEVPRVQDLRHTAASLAASAGYSLHEVKDMLGHSTIKTTSDLYLHLFEEGKKEKAASLGQLMVGARSAQGKVVPLVRETAHVSEPQGS
jgi:integrase